ncbi:MAG TPA: 6-bladed beta-propeller [Longimicrobiales bacterium]
MKKLILLTALLATPAAAQQVTRLPAQDKVLPGKPVMQFSIGAEDGEDWELLSRVTQVAFDKEENLYVLDGGNNRVLVFNPQGKFVRKFGKKGGGPGELMSPVGIAVTTTGEVAVTDLGRPAVSLFKKDGTFIKNLTLGEDFGFPVPTQGTYAHPSGGVVVRPMPPVMRRGGADEIATRTMTGRKSPLTWFTTDAKNTKLFEIPQPDITPKVQDNGAGSGQRQIAVRVMLPAFTPATLWGVLPNGAVAISNDANYNIEIARNGKVERVLQRPFTARKITEADKNKEKARRREQMSSGRGNMVFSTSERRGSGPARANTSVGGTMPKAEIDRMLNELTFNETIPVLTGMYVDPRGRLWVQRFKDVGQDGPIDLLNANGTYLGTVTGQTLPAAVSPSGRAAYIERDEETDVEKVVVRKLPAGW